MRTLLFLFLLLNYTLYCQIDFHKSITFGSTESLHTCYVDKDGYIYSGLEFKDSLINVYTDTGILQINSHIKHSVGINKLDSNGNIIWIKYFGISPSLSISGIVTDINNNIYISGVFFGTVDFDPGEDTSYLTSEYFNNFKNTSYFFLKLNSDGEFIWVKQIEAANAEGYELFINKQQEITFIGSFGYYTISDFDPGFGVHLSDTSNKMLFILRLDTDGNFVSLKQIGQEIWVIDVIQDYNENIIIYGYFLHPQDFDPDTIGVQITPITLQDGFTAKYSPQGNLKWVNHSYHNYTLYGSLSVDTSNNVFLYGPGRDKGDTIHLEIGNPLAEHIFTANENYFCKYSSEGNFQKINQIPGDKSYYWPVSSQGNLFGNHYISSSGFKQHTYGIKTSFGKIDENGNGPGLGGISTSNNKVKIIKMKNISRDNFLLVGYTKEVFSSQSLPQVPVGVFYMFGKDLTISVREIHSLTDKIVVYPNPMKDYLNIKYEGEIKNVQIFNIHGQLIKTEFTKSFSVYDLKPGLYFSIINFNPRHHFKFVKE